ncbi:FecR domain-containing protein [Hoeflea sp. TYP-13]|uniref:FecR family protein n=1 Tax=Hoeflea sp. TYP-13 TaxID=3230023 RepID=UPI0034C5D96D
MTMHNKRSGHPNRRRFLTAAAGCAGALAFSRKGLAADPIGSVTELTGEATANRRGGLIELQIGADLMVRDLIRTGKRSFLAMRLGDQTSMRLGEETELLIDEYLADVQGTFDLSNGALVFDRPEDAPKMPTTVRTVFGQIGVRGTRFFAGPSRGVFGVFVERGELEVTAADVSQLLRPGDGVDIAEPGAAASQVAKWSQERIDEAFASVEPN